MEIATKAQAENGMDNTTVMTPLRVKQSIQSNLPSPSQETDPVFSSSPAASITNQNITSWNAAQANVQSDWAQSTTTADDYIKNKPASLAYTNVDNSFSTGQTINGYLTVDGVHYQMDDLYVGRGKDLILAAQGPNATTPVPTNDSGDLVYKQWRDEGGYYYEIEKSRIWTDNTYTSPLGPNYRVSDSQGNTLYTGRLALENRYDVYETPIGTWVDGEVLYRKIFDGYLNANGTLNNSISVGGKIRTIDGYVTSVYNNAWKIGSHYFPQPLYDSCFTMDTSTNNNSFNIETNGYFTNSYYYVIVEYTK